ncbi:MAG: thiol:disulfide interchange protein [Caulobacteraceae bacterium]|nr:thiol:disulfide interchange protein [Caulobacteraceae bacterium]
MKRLAVLVLALAALTVSGMPGASARADGAVASPHAVTSLVAETAGAAPGSTLWVAVVQRLDKGWHTYWRNPGDAGEPTTLRWTLPAGWRAGEIAWPAPRRLPVGPIMNYGYEGRVILPVPLEIPLGAKAGDQARLSAAVDYLVCAEVCVPGTATVALTVPVVAGAPAPDPVGGREIAAALASTPKPAGLTARFQAAGSRLSLAIVGAPLADAPARDAYFYPYGETLIDHGKPETVDRGPHGLTLTMTAGGAFARGATPSTAAGVLALDGKTYEVTATPGPPPEGAGGLGPPAEAGAITGLAPGLALALGGAFLGGLILNLMPCVFPILSMKAAALAGHAGETRRARAQALAFLGGVLVSFLGLALALEAARAAGAAVGWGFQLQSPTAVAVLALVMLAAALNLSGLFELGTSAQGLGSGLASRGDLAGSAFTGVLAVVVAAPCTAPFMGPALGFALTQPTPVALAVFLALGLGFAAPFTLLSLSPALIRALPRPGAWMDVFRKVLAFPMYGAAAWLAWVLAQQAGPAGLARMLAAAVVLAFAAWLFGLGQRRAAVGRDARAIGLEAGAALALATAVGLAAVGGDTANSGAARAAAAPAGIPSQPWSADRLAALRAAHTPVLVNFTAAWCVTCQVNERVVFSTDEVARAFRHAGAVYLVADWTRRDGAIAKALSDEGRIGVPLYLVYGADGGPPKVLPQLLTPSLVAQALDHAAARGA